MARSGSMTYDPQTGTWKPSGNGSSSSSSSGGSSNKGSGGNSSGGSSGSKGSDNLTSSNPSKNSSAGSVEKKYNYIEINTLTGTLSYIVTEETIKLKAGDTVKLNNLGKFLSGNYFVKDVTRQISSNGYSHSATLIRTDVGSSLKSTTTTKDKQPVQKTEPSPKSPAKSGETAQRTYTVKKGDCLWNIAKKFYGNGAAYTKIYDANTKKIADPHWIYPGQVFVIP